MIKYIAKNIKEIILKIANNTIYCASTTQQQEVTLHRLTLNRSVKRNAQLHKRHHGNIKRRILLRHYQEMSVYGESLL